METEHERQLQTAINELKKQGFRIIRLDHRIVPDAIAINNKEVVAVESETSGTGVWLTRRKLEDSQYDAEIIITRPYDKQFFEPKVYYDCLELSKNGMSYREIKRTLMSKYNLQRLALSTICGWIKGRGNR